MLVSVQSKMQEVIERGRDGHTLAGAEERGWS